MPQRLTNVLLAALVCALLVAACRDDEPQPTATPTPTATVEAAPTVERTASATSTPADASTSEAREPRYPSVVVSQAGEFPLGIAVFVWAACSDCTDQSLTIWRVERAAAPVSVWSGGDTGDEPAVDAFVDHGILYVFACDPGCLGAQGVEQGAPVTLWRSLDRGETWESLGSGERPDPAEWGLARTSGRALFPDVEAGDGRFMAGTASIDLALIEDRASAPRGGPAYYVGAPAVSPSGRVAVAWAAHGLPPLSYVSIFRADGVPLATYSGEVAGLAWLDDSRLVATLTDEDGGMPAILEVFSGTAHPLTDPFEDLPGWNAVIGVIAESEG